LILVVESLARASSPGRHPLAREVWNCGLNLSLEDKVESFDEHTVVFGTEISIRRGFAV
jgi:hypothetical protein